MTVSVESFRQQMHWLHERGFVGVSAERAFLKPVCVTSNRMVVLTFDDGFESVYTIAFPILKQLGFGATLFVCPDYIGRDRVPGGNRGTRSAPCLSWPQLKEMMAYGITVGSHTNSHPLLTTLSEADADLDIRQSKETLEERLDAKVKAFAYPAGQFNGRLKQQVMAAGYVLGFCIHLRRYQSEDPWCLQRIGISGYDGMWAFRTKMSRLYARILNMKLADTLERTWLIDLIERRRRRHGHADVGSL